MDRRLAATIPQLTLPLEALRMSTARLPFAGHVEYRANVQDVGWQLSVRDGATAGTVGQVKRVEAVKIPLVPKAF
ncbi:hypothetical protein ASE25_11590 [Terrabacter sp. Root85]|uniref:hypothetical protein n=2 Tax=unclassified Terrabacter TaxID=2630222 RepID=UPI000715DF24|nr:hypothetical protein [Terrabacter sp. Root85]KRC90120.1 hypothetical protein ASE25_11590 [Terrabacter sp. Root85]KRF44957.1 hypothetical protein ASH01_13515 [Terrabacter sp. Soil811]